MSKNKNESGIDMGDYVEFRVPFFKSDLGIFFLVLQSFFILFSVIEENQRKGGFQTFLTYLITFEIFFLILYTKNMTYVLLSKDTLIVKKKIWCFSKKFVYENSNILEVQLEFINWRWAKKGVGNNTVTIITKDADIKAYKLDLFKRRTFFDLKNAMIGYGINVTDLLNLTEKEFKTFMHK